MTIATVTIDEDTFGVLRPIIYAELQKYYDRQRHAISHGDQFEVEALEILDNWIRNAEQTFVNIYRHDRVS